MPYARLADISRIETEIAEVTVATEQAEARADPEAIAPAMIPPTKR